MAEDWQAQGQDYQLSAALAQELVARLLRKLAVAEADRSGRRDMGPFVAGVIGGVVEVVNDTDMPLSELRAAMLTVFDAVAPQFEMEKAAKRAGAGMGVGGRA